MENNGGTKHTGVPVKTLKKLLKKAGLKVSGKKATLTRRAKKARLLKGGLGRAQQSSMKGLFGQNKLLNADQQSNYENEQRNKRVEEMTKIMYNHAISDLGPTRPVQNSDINLGRDADKFYAKHGLTIPKPTTNDVETQTKYQQSLQEQSDALNKMLKDTTYKQAELQQNQANSEAYWVNYNKKNPTSTSSSGNSGWSLYGAKKKRSRRS